MGEAKIGIAFEGNNRRNGIMTPEERKKKEEEHVSSNGKETLSGNDVARDDVALVDDTAHQFPNGVAAKVIEVTVEEKPEASSNKKSGPASTLSKLGRF